MEPIIATPEWIAEFRAKREAAEKEKPAEGAAGFEAKNINQVSVNTTEFSAPRQPKNDNAETPFWHNNMKPGHDRVGKWGGITLGNNSMLPAKTLSNTSRALLADPFFAGAFAFDEMAQQAVTTRTTPSGPAGPVTDAFMSKTAVWLSDCGLTVPTAMVGEAVMMLAKENTFHPVVDYLSGLEWDGKRRLDSWLQTYLKATGNQEYLAAVGSKWLISAAARALNPGCKVDTVLILEGAQGNLKSTALDILGGEFFTDQLPDLASKDSSQAILRRWIVEIPELDAL